MTLEQATDILPGNIKDLLGRIARESRMDPVESATKLTGIPYAQSVRELGEQGLEAVHLYWNSLVGREERVAC